MSRSAAALDPGQTNRRFILLALVLGIIGAVLVYSTFNREGGSGGGGNQVPVVVAKSDIAARTKITASMVEVKLLSESDRSTLAYGDAAEVVGQVTRFPIAANEQVLSNKVVPLSGTTSIAGKSLSFVVPPGRRAMAVTVKEVVAAGGLVLPGDYVDIIVVYDIEFLESGSQAGTKKADSYFIHTLLQNVEVLAVSQTIVDQVQESNASPDAPGQRVRNTEAKPNAEAITATLALTPEEAQKLYLADSNGRIRLTVRPFGDAEVRPIDSMIETELFPRNLPNPFQR